MIAVVKNEGPYLLEWIAFHRVVGVQKFFIADNVSSDGSTELLSSLSDLGIVERLLFPTGPGDAFQTRAYDALMKRFGSQAEWVATIDADEFLIPADAYSLFPMLDAFSARVDVGAIAANWAMYGSSHQDEAVNELVVARFTMRAAETYRQNNHYKSIVRPKAFVRFLNPHHIELKRQYKTVHTDGAEVEQFDGVLGRSSRIVWDRLRLNHYFVKSKAEYQFIKAPRGRADTGKATRDVREFDSFNKNQVIDPLPERLVIATREEMERIRGELLRGGCNPKLINLDRYLTELVKGARNNGAAAQD